MKEANVYKNVLLLKPCLRRNVYMFMLNLFFDVHVVRTTYAHDAF